MAIQHLSDEQIRTWSRAQKDEWWFKNVFRGDMPQLTLRSAITGFLLGGVLSATALYIIGKTGITIGVGLTSVILSFAIFRILSGAAWPRITRFSRIIARSRSPLQRATWCRRWVLRWPRTCW